MKKICFFLIFFGIIMTGCKTSKTAATIKSDKTPAVLPGEDAAPAAVNFSDQTTWLLGYFNLSQLTSEPYSSWYQTGYDDYQFKTDAMNRLLEINKDGIKIKIVLGTWCPDSRREVPRFMRILDIWQFPLSEVTFIGVDNSKLSPVGEYNGLDIQRVPTFIIYKNNNEKGRIIENPKTSLEQDMFNILTRSE